MIERKTYYWGVPLSSSAPYLAHLIRDGQTVTNKLCNQSRVINRETTLAVDAFGYELKCRVCYAMGLKVAEVNRYAAPDLRTSKQVSAMRHLLFPHTPSGRRRKPRRNGK